MSRLRRPANPCSKKEVPPRRPQRPLDATARTACEGFADLLDRCGYGRGDVVNAVRTAPRPDLDCIDWPSSGQASDDGAHIVTLWHMTPGYVDSEGEPIAIPLKGPMPSIEHLVSLANLNLTLDGAISYLRAAKALRKVGNRFAPRSRLVLHRTGTETQAQHHLRVVAGLMQTVRHNSSTPVGRRWLQAAADGVVPRAGQYRLQKEFREISMELLKTADSLMHHDRRASARSVPMTICVYVFEGGPVLSDSPSSTRRLRPRKTHTATRAQKS
jgi:hypothetical protein